MVANRIQFFAPTGPHLKAPSSERRFFFASDFFYLHSLPDVIGTTPSLVQIGTDFSQNTREPLRSIRAWVSWAAR
jgi:hypothetical protein